MKNIYIVAAAASIMIYVLGVITGVYVQRSVLNTVESDINSVRADVENAQDQYILLGFRGKESCAVLSSLSGDISDKLGSVLSELNRLEAGGERGPSFLQLKNEYTTLTLKAWILRASINADCEKNVQSVLYYYAVPCAQCIKQGDALDDVVSKFDGNVAVYAVDKDVDVPLLRTMLKSHKITSAPSLVIDTQVYSGFLSKDNLTDILCQKINATACNR